MINKKYGFGFVTTLFAFVAMFLTLNAFAQVDPAAAPTSDDWTSFFNSLASLKAGGIFAIILAVVQLAMLVVRQFVQGKFKLLIVSGLTLVATIIGGLASGQPILGVLMSAAVLTAIQVFIHQIFTQITEKKV